MLRATEDGEIAGVNFTGASLASTLWRTTERFLPRPIVSIHAVQPEQEDPTDEVTFSVYAWVAEVLKLHEPGMHNMWITTFYDVRPPWTLFCSSLCLLVAKSRLSVFLGLYLSNRGHICQSLGSFLLFLGLFSGLF